MKLSQIFYGILVLMLFPVLAFAQSETENTLRSESSYYHQKGGHLLSLGSGIITNPTTFSFDLFTGGSGSGKPSPSINLSYEYGLSSQIGIGALVNYYRVDAQQELDIQDLLGSDLLDDPLCLAECLLPISLGSSCDCGTQKVEERINVFTLAGKLSYHIIKLQKLDTYTNVTLGYSFNRRKTISEEVLGELLEQIKPDTNVPTFVYYVSVGARYFFNPKLAAFGEFGYSNVHLAQIGLSYRWK